MEKELPKTFEAVCANLGVKPKTMICARSSIFLSGTTEQAGLWLENAVRRLDIDCLETMEQGLIATASMDGMTCVLWAEWFPVGEGTHVELTAWSKKRHVREQTCQKALSILTAHLPQDVRSADIPRCQIDHPLTQEETDKILEEALGQVGRVSGGGPEVIWAAKMLKTYESRAQGT